MHVGDFIWAGTEEFINKLKLTDRFRSTYLCRKEADNSFWYIGLNIQLCQDGIKLHQHDYVPTLSMISVAEPSSSRARDDANETE